MEREDDLKKQPEGAELASRGPVTEWLLAHLAEPAHRVDAMPEPSDDPLAGDDSHLALYLGYELHYGGLPGVDERWEWEPSLLEARARLEERFEQSLTDLVPRPERVAPDGVAPLLRELASADDGPSLSKHLRSSGTRAQFREFLAHRSAYQLKEADPHSWAIPRLAGPAKAALVEIQYDEYGAGDAGWMHSELFRQTMESIGLDGTPGAYLDLIPGATLATVNLVSMFGLHRRWRGALCGHLALFEMTSSIPNRRYADGLRRLGFGPEATLFFDEHVEADAVHEQIALNDLAGSLARQEPAVAADIVFGARALAELESRWAGRLLTAWEAGRTSLLRPLAASRAA